MYVYIYIYIYIYIYTHTHIHTYVHTYVHTYIQTVIIMMWMHHISPNTRTPHTQAKLLNVFLYLLNFMLYKVHHDSYCSKTSEHNAHSPLPERNT